MVGNLDSPLVGLCHVSYDNMIGCGRLFHVVLLVLLLVLDRATLMPCQILPWTDPLPCCQLIDLLNETEGLEEGKVLPTHDQRSIGTDT